MPPDRRPCSVEVSRTADAPIAAVWAALADAHSYGRWVAGTGAIRGTTGEWPAVGASLHHRWGLWPLHVRDHTTVTACEPRRRLDLMAHVGALATVEITIRLEETPPGTRVVLRESVVRGWALLCRPLTGWVQRWRNRRSLAALDRLCARGSTR